jgi:hypothetical protein
MTQAGLSRRQVRKQRVCEKATIDHLVRAVYQKAEEERRVHAAFTLSGLSVEEQLRKAWQWGVCGLAIF